MRKLFVFCFITSFLLIGCSPKVITEFRDVEKIVYQYRADTLITETKDSVYIHIKEKGDTITITKYVEKISYKDKIVIQKDTVYNTNTEYKETVIEKRYIAKWCWYLAVVGIIALCYPGFRIYKFITKI